MPQDIIPPKPRSNSQAGGASIPPNSPAPNRPAAAPSPATPPARPAQSPAGSQVLGWHSGEQAPKSSYTPLPPTPPQHAAAPYPAPTRRRPHRGLWVWSIVSLLLFFAGLATGYYIAKWQGADEGASPTSRDTSLQQVQEAGVLRIGTSLTELPWGAYNKDSGEPEGAEVELAGVLGEKLGVKVELINKGFDDLIPELVAKKFDVIMAGISITPERSQQINFTDPYFTAGQVIIARTDESSINGKDDLGGKTVGVLAGTTSETYAKSLAAEAAGPEVRSYDEAGKYFADLSAGTIDAVIYDSVAGSWYSKQNPGFKVVGSKLTEEGYGIGVRREDETLRTALNTAIAELRADPRYQQILAKWYE